MMTWMLVEAYSYHSWTWPEENMELYLRDAVYGEKSKYFIQNLISRNFYGILLTWSRALTNSGGGNLSDENDTERPWSDSNELKNMKISWNSNCLFKRKFREIKTYSWICKSFTVLLEMTKSNSRILTFSKLTPLTKKKRENKIQFLFLFYVFTRRTYPKLRCCNLIPHRRPSWLIWSIDFRSYMLDFQLC